MKTITYRLAPLALIVTAGFLAGCSAAPAKSVDISDTLRHSLDAAGLKQVSVSQDRDKGVVTLSGNVPNESNKDQAASIASSVAAGQVVANQISVVPVGAEHDTKAINSDLDKGIAENLDAALIQGNLRKYVNFRVQSNVVTLTGEVVSEDLRAQSATIAAAVPNVQQVVNELQVKNQKASSN